MEQYKTFIHIRIEHNYYSTPVAGHFTLEPTPATRMLMKRRGLLFVNDSGGWSWSMRADSSGFDTDDLLELTLQAVDKNFLQVTRLDGYHPQQFYQLKLDNKKLIDVATSLTATEEKKQSAELCRLRIKPTTALLKKAQKGEPASYTLRFRPSSFRWEYLFVIRNAQADLILNLLLEESRQRIEFDEAEKLNNSPFGINVWRIFSKSSVNALEHSDYQLIISSVIQDNPLKKRIVSRFIPCPQPGKYLSDDPGTIRHICFI
ncbi:hypothetical protein [Bacteroides sp.]|uniref:hypothetical protein n=1 Tax=Bacteroides sp. TaxID=29523 RepID=UPI002628D50C|nr:hypothetical protein [Bacteroides sp.]MDD3038148.1 hypothetical protein [Bacteroides sp.]